MWKATKTVGCGVATCQGIFDPSFGPAQLHICFYDPVVSIIQDPQFGIFSCLNSSGKCWWGVPVSLSGFDGLEIYIADRFPL